MNAERVARLAVDQGRVAVERRLEIAVIGHLDDRHVVPERQQEIEAALGRVGEEVRDHDDEAAAAAGREHLPDRPVEVCLAASVEIGEIVQSAPDLAGAVERAENLVHVAGVTAPGVTRSRVARAM